MKKKCISDSDENKIGGVPGTSLLYDAIRHFVLFDLVQSHKTLVQVETVAKDMNAMYMAKVIEMNRDNDKAKVTINETIKKQQSNFIYNICFVNDKEK